MRIRGQRRWTCCAALVVAILAGPVLTRAQERRPPSPGNAQSFPVQQASRNEPARFDGTSGEKQLLLSPPRHDAAADKSSGGSRMLGAIVSVVVSLAVVLGLFFIVAWFMRRGLPNSTRRLPAEVVEVLGRTPLAGRQQMHVLRFGNKLLLVCASATGVDPIGEITDPLEIDRLAGLCAAQEATSASTSFKQIFGQMGREKVSDRAAVAANISTKARRSSISAGEGRDV
jgi:flagellar biogenesis protein FliO